MTKLKQWIAVILLIVSVGFLIRTAFFQTESPASSEPFWVVYFASGEDVYLTGVNWRPTPETDCRLWLTDPE